MGSTLSSSCSCLPFCLILWLSLSLLVSLGFCTINFRRYFSSFFSPLKWKSMASVVYSWVFTFPQVCLALIISQQIGLWLTSYPWGQALLGTWCFGVLIIIPFSLPPSGSLKGFISYIFCWKELVQATGGKSQNIVKSPCDWFPCGF